MNIHVKMRTIAVLFIFLGPKPNETRVTEWWLGSVRRRTTLWRSNYIDRLRPNFRPCPPVLQVQTGTDPPTRQSGTMTGGRDRRPIAFLPWPRRWREREALEWPPSFPQKNKWTRTQREKGGDSLSQATRGRP